MRRTTRPLPEEYGRSNHGESFLMETEKKTNLPRNGEPQKGKRPGRWNQGHLRCWWFQFDSCPYHRLRLKVVLRLGTSYHTMEGTGTSSQFRRYGRATLGVGSEDVAKRKQGRTHTSVFLGFPSNQSEKGTNCKNTETNLHGSQHELCLIFQEDRENSPGRSLIKLATVPMIETTH